MLKYDDFFDYIYQRQLLFHWEDQNEIQFTSDYFKGEVEEEIRLIYEKYRLEFTISIDEHNISIPSELQYISNIVSLSYSKNVDVLFKFKKRELTNSSDNENVILYKSLSNLEYYLNTLDFDELTSFVFNKKTFCKILLVEEVELLSNSYITLQTVFEQEGNNPNTKGMQVNKGDTLLEHESPEKMYFDISSDYKVIEIFNKCCSFLCLSLLSSSVEKLKEKDTYNFQFNGQKKVTLRATFENSHVYEIDNLVEFYIWVYSEKTEDKMIIFHNLLPLHINLQNPAEVDRFLEVLPELVTATKENFNFYIQDNIKTYLDERKKIEDMVMNTSSLISNEINRITDLLVRIITGVFVSIISSIIAFSLSSSLQSIVGYGFFFLTFMIITLMVIVIYFSKSSVDISFNNFQNRLKEYTKLYNEDTINKFEKPVNERKALFIKMTKIISFVLIALNGFVFAIGMYFKNGSNVLINKLIEIVNYLN